MPTQTEVIYTAITLQNTLGEGLRAYEGKLWNDKRIQTDFQDESKARPATPVTIRKPKPYMYDEKRQLLSPHVTAPKPFHLSKPPVFAHYFTHYPARTFIMTFIERLEQKDERYFNVCAISTKQLIKIINQLYAEKMLVSRDSSTTRLQSLVGFLYDSYINKYGLLNVAEKKLKEILLACVNTRTRLLKVELFSRFLELSEPHYTNDDLHFMFSIARLLLQNISNATYVKREAAVFELVGEVDLEYAQQTTEHYFKEKVSREVLLNIQERVTQLSTECELYWKNSGKFKKDKPQVDCDSFYKIMIEQYRKLKQNFCQHLILCGAVRKDASYTTDFYSQADFLSLASALNWNEQVPPEIFFDTWASYVFDPSDEEPKKKLSLEVLISQLLRQQNLYEMKLHFHNKLIKTSDLL